MALSLLQCSVDLSLILVPLLSALLSPPVLPESPEAGLVDERCPLMTGCDRAGEECVCDARHSCLGSFSYPDQESCMKASKTGEESQYNTHIHTTTGKTTNTYTCKKTNKHISNNTHTHTHT